LYTTKQQSHAYSHVLPYKSEVLNYTYTIACTTYNIRVHFDFGVHQNIQCLQIATGYVVGARPRPLAHEHAFSPQKADEKQGTALEVAIAVPGDYLSTCGRLGVIGRWGTHGCSPSMVIAGFWFWATADAR